MLARGAVISALAVALTADPGAGQPLDTPTLVQRSLPNVVTIRLQTLDGTTAGTGTAFFIAPDEVVTNWHVAALGSKGVIVLASGQEFWIERVLAVDRAADFCILAVATEPVLLDNGDGEPLKAAANRAVARNVRRKVTGLRLATVAPQVGERVVVIGSPLGLQNSVSEGIVSAIRTGPPGTALQLTAAISPGSSGSPVLDSNGEVIGVATSRMVDGASLNFAVPSAVIREAERLPDPPLFAMWGWEEVTPEERSKAASLVDSVRSQIAAKLAGYVSTLLERQRAGADNAQAIDLTETAARRFSRHAPAVLNASGKYATIDDSGWEHAVCLYIDDYEPLLSIMYEATALDPTSADAAEGELALRERAGMWRIKTGDPEQAALERYWRGMEPLKNLAAADAQQTDRPRRAYKRYAAGATGPEGEGADAWSGGTQSRGWWTG